VLYGPREKEVLTQEGQKLEIEGGRTYTGSLTPFSTRGEKAGRREVTGEEDY